MDIVILILWAVVVGVLLVSGVAKLFDHEGSAEAMVGFGVPTALVPLAAHTLPWFEIALAVGLILDTTTAVAALGTMLLFAAFTIGAYRVVVAGKDLDCHCFGQLQSGPVDRTTVWRNLALTISAGLVFWWAQFRATESFTEQLAWVHIAVGVVAILFLAQGWFVAHLWKAQATLQARINELQQQVTARGAITFAAYSFADTVGDLSVTNADDVYSGVSTLHEIGTPSLLMFVSSRCRPCIAIMPDVARWQHELSESVRITTIFRGAKDEILFLAEELHLTGVFFNDSEELDTAMQVGGTPAAVLIDSDGMVRHETALGSGAIQGLIDQMRSANAA